jgi:copper chaperone CopZ
MTQITLAIDGMHCQKCVGSVTNALQAVAGVTQVSVTLEPGAAQIDFDPAQTDVAALKAAIEDTGFDVV